MSDLETIVYFNAQPTEWLSSRVCLSWLPVDFWNAADAAANLPFVHGHVGGHGTNSPQRGVCVQCVDSAANIVGHWTLTQNKSQCTLATKAVAMDSTLSAVVPTLKKISEQNFPDTPISEASFSLFVANEYLPGRQHTICDHTDDQDWYPSPPIFASLTFFPDGPPSDPRETFRFQLFDEGDKTWKDVHLPDRSVCMMRADIRHRVLPPLSKYANECVRRINLTYRNLISPLDDPLGYLVGMSNHFRYYGIPSTVTVPQDFDMSAISSVLDKLRALNPNLQVRYDTRTGKQRSEAKRECRTQIKKLYRRKSLNLNDRMLSRSNVTLELLERVVALA